MEFKKIIIDPDIEDIIPSFIENTILDFNKMRLAYSQKDLEEMRSVCHTVLGTAESYGFVELDEIVRKLQTSLKENNSDEIEESFNLLTSHIDFIKKEFSV